ncbi:MAG: hypothetical protein P8X82_17330, partial [Gemmatimonadales bacterium]
WVDLRPDNCAIWKSRTAKMIDLHAMGGNTTGSDADWAIIKPEDEIEPSRFAAWVFSQEDGGARIKR